jgi:hypothetical protein
VALVAILRFSLKKQEMEKKSWRGEAAIRSWDQWSMSCVTISTTRAQLAEMQERLDFAERLLTAGRASQEDRGR